MIKEWEREQLMRRCYSQRLAGKDAFAIAEGLQDEGVMLSVPQVLEYADEWAARQPTQSNPEARKQEIDRIDVWLSRVDGDYSRPVDDERRMSTKDAVAAFCRLSERRCKLLGLDAPSKSEITALLANKPASIDEEIAQLAIELGLNSE